jgi:hypothetical protein
MKDLSTDKYCWKCGKELPFDTRILRSEQCPWCGADLHVCYNCRFHDRAAHNECSEVGTFEVQDRDRANYCNEFQYRQGHPGRDDEADKAKEKLKDLFKF